MSPSPYRKSLRTPEMLTETRRQRLQDVLEKRQTDFTVVIENIWDPHNVSAILRSADAVGIRDIHLLYYIEKAPDFSKVGKLSSASARKWLEIHNHDNIESCFASLRYSGFSVYASHLTEYSLSIHELDGLQKIALVFGNESRGVSEEACRLADGIFAIPMLGTVESLNASVAAAVSMYEIARQRLNAGRYDSPTMDAAELDAAFQKWAIK